MLGHVSAHISQNAISNLELRRSYKALCNYVVLPSASPLSNSCRRESSLTVDASEKQLPSQNTAGLVFDGWKSTNKQAIPSVIAY